MDESEPVGLSNFVSRSEMNAIREIPSTSKSKMSVDQSPFQMTHISQLDEEIEE